MVGEQISQNNILGRIPPDVKAFGVSVAVGEIALAALVGLTYKTATSWQDRVNAMAMVNFLSCGLPIWMPFFCYLCGKEAKKELENRRAVKIAIAKNIEDRRRRQGEEDKRQEKKQLEEIEEKARIHNLITEYNKLNFYRNC